MKEGLLLLKIIYKISHEVYRLYGASDQLSD